jgi:hypothetical protein
MKKLLAIAAVLVATQATAAQERRLSGHYLVSGTMYCMSNPSGFLLYQNRVTFDDKQGIYQFHVQTNIDAIPGDTLAMHESKGARPQPFKLDGNQLKLGTAPFAVYSVYTGVDSTGLVVTMTALYIDTTNNCGRQETYTHVDSFH